jgi:hypothetical protein
MHSLSIFWHWRIKRSWMVLNYMNWIDGKLFSSRLTLKSQEILLLCVTVNYLHGQSIFEFSQFHDSPTISSFTQVFRSRNNQYWIWYHSEESRVNNIMLCSKGPLLSSSEIE